MCTPMNGHPRWGSHPKNRVSIGGVRDSGVYALLSEAEGPDGEYYCIWIPTEKGLARGENLVIIDKITKRRRRWTYAREYQCTDLRHAIDTYFGLVPQ